MRVPTCGRFDVRGHPVEISRKTDYALRMLAELVRQPDGLLSVRSAAERNDVPYSFARSIQHDLVDAGIVESLRGAHGGMRLVADPAQTTLVSVVEAVQGPVRIAACDEVGEDGGPCPRMETCPFNPIWCGATRMLHDFLASVTLSDIVNGDRAPSLPSEYWGADAFEYLRRPIKERLEE